MKIFSAFILLLMMFFLAQPLFAKSTINNTCTKTCCGKKQDEKNKCSGTCNPFFSCAYCQYISKKTVEIKSISKPVASKFFELGKQNLKEGYLLASWKPPNKLHDQQTI